MQTPGSATGTDAFEQVTIIYILKQNNLIANPIDITMNHSKEMNDDDVKLPNKI